MRLPMHISCIFAKKAACSQPAGGRLGTRAGIRTSAQGNLQTGQLGRNPVYPVNPPHTNALPSWWSFFFLGVLFTTGANQITGRSGPTGIHLMCCLMRRGVFVNRRPPRGSDAGLVQWVLYLYLFTFVSAFVNSWWHGLPWRGKALREAALGVMPPAHS